MIIKFQAAKKRKGQILVTILMLSLISTLFIIGLVSWAIVSKKVSQKNIYSETAFQIAEAGVEYYRWHLAHGRQDYQDGQGSCCPQSPCSVCGPYTHNYYDQNNNLIGQFILKITPPSSGSTAVTINSEGRVSADSSVKRVVETQMAIPSFAKYAIAANDKMNFGVGTEVFGEVHSNDGIRFDGLAHNLVTSSKSQYDDPDHEGSEEFGVHTHVSPIDPLPPNSIPNRPDVFMAGRNFPTPAIDFTGMTGDLATIKAAAQQNGVYLPHSGYQGYRLLLKIDGTFDLYRVFSIQPRPNFNCNSDQDEWGIWSIQNQTFIQNYQFPANGLIFLEDNVWVEGQINNARLTIASARFPENPNTNTNIIVNNDLKYTNYNGQDVIGLMAQKNINIGLYSEDDLQIDAALIAKNGRVGRYYYNSSCGSNYIRQRLTLNGMIATNQRYGFTYSDNTGYQIRILNYDTNLLYGAPPNFPVTSDQYVILSWREIK